MVNEKKQALALYLQTKEEIEVSSYDENVLEAEGGEYLVLTDEEADERAKDDILNLVWAFNADFIIEHSSALDYDDASKRVVSAIADQCESGNEAMKKLIDDLDEFVEDAIGADGRGHFLASYDGDEWRQKVNKTNYYIYRIN